MPARDYHVLKSISMWPRPLLMVQPRDIEAEFAALGFVRFAPENVYSTCGFKRWNGRAVARALKRAVFRSISVHFPLIFNRDSVGIRVGNAGGGVGAGRGGEGENGIEHRKHVVLRVSSVGNRGGEPP